MIKLTCLQCEKEYEVGAHRVGISKFCSVRCKGDAWVGHKPWNKGIHYTEQEKKRLNMSGLALGRTPEVNASKIGKRFSPATEFKKGYKQKTGEAHYLWKGGRVPLQKKIRQSTPYKDWRTAVFERDNYTCLSCGVRGRELNADHIETFSQILDKHGIDSVQKALICADLWDTNNGRTLCIDCHRKTDTWGRNLRKNKDVGSIIAQA